MILNLPLATQQVPPFPDLIAPIRVTAHNLSAYLPPPQQSLTVMGLMLFVIATYYCAYLLGTRTKAAARERKMAGERKLREDQEVADMITDGIEDMIHKGKLTRDRANFYYNRFGRTVPLKDLLQKHLLALKDKLKEKHKDRPVKSNVTKFIKRK